MTWWIGCAAKWPGTHRRRGRRTGCATVTPQRCCCREYRCTWSAVASATPMCRPRSTPTRTLGNCIRGARSRRSRCRGDVFPVFDGLRHGCLSWEFAIVIPLDARSALETGWFLAGWRTGCGGLSLRVRPTWSSSRVWFNCARRRRCCSLSSQRVEILKPCSPPQPSAAAMVGPRRR